MKGLRAPSTPFQSHRDVARHAARKADDLGSELVAARFEMPVPESVDLLGDASQRLFPASLLLIDGAAAVRAQPVREAVHLDFALAVVDGALDHFRGAADTLFIRNA